jgi:hypothetical protein
MSPQTDPPEGALPRGRPLPDHDDQLEQPSDQLCLDCDRLIIAHENSYWKRHNHIIRCIECAARMRAENNYTVWESFYVL